MHVRFLCEANSIRSQMAEGAFRSLADEFFTVSSAGIFAHRVDENAIAVMREVEIDISGHTSKDVDDPSLPVSDVFVDLTIKASHSLRFGALQEAKYLHRPVEDPAWTLGFPRDIRLAAFRRARDRIFEIASELLSDLRQEERPPTTQDNKQGGDSVVI